MAKSSISVVDDDDSIRESLRGLIRSIGFPVNIFASAEEFLHSDHLQDTNCLIVDVRMPGMNGIELHRQLMASHRKIPVIFITAHGDEEARVRALRDGAIAFLSKPFSEDALLNALYTALDSNDAGTKNSRMSEKGSHAN